MGPLRTEPPSASTRPGLRALVGELLAHPLPHPLGHGKLIPLGPHLRQLLDQLRRPAGPLNRHGRLRTGTCGAMGLLSGSGVWLTMRYRRLVEP